MSELRFLDIREEGHEPESEPATWGGVRACLGMVMVSSPLISLARIPSSLASFLRGALMSTALRGLADKTACRSKGTCFSFHEPTMSSDTLHFKGS